MQLLFLPTPTKKKTENWVEKNQDDKILQILSNFHTPRTWKKNKPKGLISLKKVSKGYLGGSDGKESPCNVGDPSSIPGSGKPPGKGNDNPLQVFLPGEFHG